MRIANRLSLISFWSLSGISFLGSWLLFGLTGLMAMASGPMTEPGNETSVLVLLALCFALSAWLFIGSIVAMSLYAVERKRAAWLAIVIVIVVVVASVAAGLAAL
jgi:hypothetical protein